MNKKGFTLIELLAVIVILAVIALISTPIILGIIDSSKESALKSSAYGILDAAEVYYASNMLENSQTIEFVCDENGCKSEETSLHISGKVDNGKVKIYSDGKVSICIENGTTAASKKAIETEVMVSKGSCNFEGSDYSIDESIS